MQPFRRHVLLLLAMLILGAAVGRAFAQTTTRANDETFSAQELEKIQRRLEQLREGYQQLRDALAAIKAELAIVKVRVTR